MTLSVMPVLFIPYFVYRRQFRVAAWATAAPGYPGRYCGNLNGNVPKPLLSASILRYTPCTSTLSKASLRNCPAVYGYRKYNPAPSRYYTHPVPAADVKLCSVIRMDLHIRPGHGP